MPTDRVPLPRTRARTVTHIYDPAESASSSTAVAVSADSAAASTSSTSGVQHAQDAQDARLRSIQEESEDSSILIDSLNLHTSTNLSTVHRAGAPDSLQNLVDSGSGSFAEACKTRDSEKGHRNIVGGFRVISSTVKTVDPTASNLNSSKTSSNETNQLHTSPSSRVKELPVRVEVHAQKIDDQDNETKHGDLEHQSENKTILDEHESNLQLYSLLDYSSALDLKSQKNAESVTISIGPQCQSNHQIEYTTHESEESRPLEAEAAQASTCTNVPPASPAARLLSLAAFQQMIKDVQQLRIAAEPSECTQTEQTLDEDQALLERGPTRPEDMLRRALLTR